MKFVIPSKGRSASINEKTLRLVPDAIVCVAESEKAMYEDVCSAKIITHPDKISGIGMLRNWIVENVSDGICVMLDDDIEYVYDQTGLHKQRIEEPSHCMAILERTAIAAKDANVRVFGYTQMARPLSFKAFDPIGLNTWVGGVVGVVGTSPLWDNDLILRADIDACLRSMLNERIVFVDGRYCWIHKRFVGSGGNNTARTDARHTSEIKKLQSRWGKYLGVKTQKSVIRITVKVKRR